MMRQPHKYAKEITHWLNGGEIEYRVSLTQDEEWGSFNPEDYMSSLFFSGGYEFRIKPQIPKTRIKESSYVIYKREIEEQLDHDYTQHIIIQKVMMHIAQESLRLAVENGDLIIQTK